MDLYLEDIDPVLPCDSGGTGVDQTITDLEYVLPEVGEYRIIKTLALDIESMQLDFDSLLADSLPDLQDFIDDYLAGVDTSGCFNTCDEFCTVIKKTEYEEINGPGTWDNLSQAVQEDSIASCVASACDGSEFYEDFESDNDPTATGWDNINPVDISCDVFYTRMVDQISPGGVFYENANSEFWDSVVANLPLTIESVTYNTLGALQAAYDDTIAMWLVDNGYHRESCHYLDLTANPELYLCDEWAESYNYGNELNAAIMDANVSWPTTSPTAGMFYAPYDESVTAGTTNYTNDPFVNSPFDPNDELQDAINTYLDSNAFECNSTQYTTGNLWAYCDALVNNCINPSTGAEQMKKQMFFGIYNNIKLELMNDYFASLNPECEFFSDVNTVFLGAMDSTQLMNSVMSGISSTVNSTPCAVNAWNWTQNWMDQIPDTCLLSLADANPTYHDTDYVEADLVAITNPTYIEQLFYDYALASCIDNTWGWFYDPLGNTHPAQGEYDSIMLILATESVCSNATQFFEVDTTNFTIDSLGVTNQYFSDCFMAFMDVFNDAIDSAGANAPSSVSFDVNTTTSGINYDDVETYCNGLDGQITASSTSSGTEIAFTETGSGSHCSKFILKEAIDGTPPGLLAEDVDYIDNPTKYDTLTIGSTLYAGVITFDAYMLNGTVKLAYIDTVDIDCIDYGDFSDITIVNVTSVETTLPDDIQDCINMTLGQAAIDAENLYNQMVNELQDQFLGTLNNCMESVTENFAMKYELKEYQYTLYYYDLAGNLVQTVPPQGVGVLEPGDFDTLGVWIGGTNPGHTMETRYQYNGLNTLIAQYTPDGRKTEFHLDKLYRVRFSQNARQVVDKESSYSKYDELGRVTEAGEFTIPSGSSGSASDMYTYLKSNVEDNAIPGANLRMDYTETFYEKAYPIGTAAIAANFTNGEQRNLRNAIGAIFHHQANYDDAGVLATGAPIYNTLISYSYDVHKNVEEMVTTIYDLEELEQEHKTVRYDYDLISGNVNEVKYQEGEEDEYRHRYDYDANNRFDSCIYQS